MNLASRLEDALPDETFALLRLVAGEATRRGLSLYAVGGLPRDLLLHRLTRDLDLVLESDAIPFARALARSHGGHVVTHPAFHTATWFLPPHLMADATSAFIDLISARSETYARPAALPTVKLGNITDDLSRRDFTINAMAIRLDGDQYGKLLTPFEGQADLRRGRLRVLHPRSFIDDPTRLFRIVRYTGRYGFKIASDTSALIPAALKFLDKLSPERLRHEMDLILAEPQAASMLDRLASLGVLAAIQPAVPPLASGSARWLGHVPPAAFDLPADVTALGYLLWFMDVPEAELGALADRLDFTAALTRSLRAAARLKHNLSAFSGFKPSQWTERLDAVPPLAVYAVFLVTHHKALKNYLLRWRHIHSTLTGDDLKTRGLPPGPEYKRILTALRSAWLDGEVTDKREERKKFEKLIQKQ